MSAQLAAQGFATRIPSSMALSTRSLTLGFPGMGTQKWPSRKELLGAGLSAVLVALAGRRPRGGGEVVLAHALWIERIGVREQLLERLLGRRRQRGGEAAGGIDPRDRERAQVRALHAASLQ